MLKTIAAWSAGFTIMFIFPVLMAYLWVYGYIVEKAPW